MVEERSGCWPAHLLMRQEERFMPVPDKKASPGASLDIEQLYTLTLFYYLEQGTKEKKRKNLKRTAVHHET